MNTKKTKKKHGEFSLCVIESRQKAKQICSKEASVIKIGEHIIFDLDVLETYGYEGWKLIHYDLLVVSAAIEYADRHHKRRLNQWSRTFKITVPVFEQAKWDQASVQKSLRATLRHLTGDDWDFTFVKSQAPSPLNLDQLKLKLNDVNKHCVIAFSDGIDSHCVSNIYGKNHGAWRIRIIKNGGYPKKSKKKPFEEKPFEEIPFKVDGKKSPESSFRSRGFKFSAITAIVAQISTLQNIIVPESGQGALGPILLPLKNIYPDYRNHPTYFRKMEVFIDALLGYKLFYDQPRLWCTKGQTIRECIENTDCSTADMNKTRSCWQQRWNVKVHGERQRQCGLCVACLLRRMSMYAAGVIEPENTYVFSNLSANCFEDAQSKDIKVSPSPAMIEYGITGTRHLQHLADMSKLSDKDLGRHAFVISGAINIPQQETLKQLRNLLETHKDEWDNFLELQGKQSFLRVWVSGELNG